MSKESLASNSNFNQSSTLKGANRVSIDGSVNLNDDLAFESEYSTGSFISSQSQNLHRRSESAFSIRNSLDDDSSFSSSAFLQSFNQASESNTNETFSTLGPNSIYELTIGSDLARIKKKRSQRTSITVNGGHSTISNLNAPTIKDIPQIQLSKLKKKVTDKEIENAFLMRSSDEYKAFEMSYKSLTEDTLHKFAEEDINNGKLSASSSLSNFGQFDNRRESDGLYIPKVFMEPGFRLDDPRIFKQVTENSKIIPDDVEESSLNLVDNHHLQERLSNYLDNVEVSLINAISKSSDSFFGTIDDISEIKSQSNACMVKFEELVSKLKDLEDKESLRGMRIISKIREKNNLEVLESHILQLKYIISIFSLAKKSYNNEKFSTCLKEIRVVESLIHGMEYDYVDDEVTALYPKLKFPTVDLSRLPALINVRNDLQNLKMECSRCYLDSFIELLLTDLRDQYNGVSTQDSINRIYVSIDKSRKYSIKNINFSYQSISDITKEKLREYIKDLTNAGNLVLAYSTYQDKIIAEVKDIIKLGLPDTHRINTSLSADILNAPSRSSSLSPETGNVSNQQLISSTNNTLSSNIKAMSSNEFELMLRKIYANLSECLRRLTAHQKILLDFALTAIPSSQDIDVMSLDITLSINKAIELTQVRLTKIVNVRIEQIADLNPQNYMRLYAISSAYMQECELISPGYIGGPGNSLIDWFKHHITYFIHRFHSGTIKSLIVNCDTEIWKEVTQPENLQGCQHIINELIGYSEFIESDGISGFSGGPWIEMFDLYDTKESTSVEVKREIDSPITKLSVGGEMFMVPGLILKSLSQIKDYILISKAFPNSVSTIENNLLSYFKLLNSKVFQAILNAGATRTAGLKHITTKHLALCIQLVEFYILLLSSLQNIFKNSTANSQSNNNSQQDDLNFGTIISNFKDHENELFSKLVSIMYDRASNHCASIVSTDWSLPIESPRQCHSYMETLVKDTLTVIKVLSRYLPEFKCSLIMSQIFDNYKKQFVNCFCTQVPQFKDLYEKQRALKDIDYFRVKLCESPGYGSSGHVIWENVNSLPTIEDTKMEEVMKSNIEGERKQNLQGESNSNKNSIEISSNPTQTQTSQIEKGSYIDEVKPVEPEKKYDTMNKDIANEVNITNNNERNENQSNEDTGTDAQNLIDMIVEKDEINDSDKTAPTVNYSEENRAQSREEETEKSTGNINTTSVSNGQENEELEDRAITLISDKTKKPEVISLKMPESDTYQFDVKNKVVDSNEKVEDEENKINEIELGVIPCNETDGNEAKSEEEISKERNFDETVSEDIEKTIESATQSGQIKSECEVNESEDIDNIVTEIRSLNLNEPEPKVAANKNSNFATDSEILESNPGRKNTDAKQKKAKSKKKGKKKSKK